MFRASDFKSKEVIDISDGGRLGAVFDMEISTPGGEIVSIVVPGKDKIRLFGRCDGVVIPWECIKKFGGDTILVDLSQIPKQRDKKGN